MSNSRLARVVVVAPAPRMRAARCHRDGKPRQPNRSRAMRRIARRVDDLHRRAHLVGQLALSPVHLVEHADRRLAVSDRHPRGSVQYPSTSFLHEPLDPCRVDPPRPSLAVRGSTSWSFRLAYSGGAVCEERRAMGRSGTSSYRTESPREGHNARPGREAIDAPEDVAVISPARRRRRTPSANRCREPPRIHPALLHRILRSRLRPTTARLGWASDRSRRGGGRGRGGAVSRSVRTMFGQKRKRPSPGEGEGRGRRKSPGWART